MPILQLIAIKCTNTAKVGGILASGTKVDSKGRSFAIVSGKDWKYVTLISLPQCELKKAYLNVLMSDS